MKTLKYLTNIALVLSLAMLTSCSSDNDFEEGNDNNGNNVNATSGERLIFSAGLESSDATRATISGKNINWESTDVIAVFCDNKDKVANFDITPSTSNSTTATFSCAVSDLPDDFTPYYYYAIYPYNVEGTTASATFTPSSSTFSSSLPATQVATTGYTYDKNAMIMIACAERDEKKLSFKNIPAYAKITLKKNSKVEYIKIVANNKANQISGSFTASVNYNGSVTYTSSAKTSEYNKNSVELKISPKEAETTYYIAMLPGTLNKGFSIYLESEFDNSTKSQSIYQLVSSSSIPISRSKVYDLGTYDIDELESKFLNDVVDLGLPSGTIWSTKNVKATSNDSYTTEFVDKWYSIGGYYAWGEITAYQQKTDWGNHPNKTSYDDNNYYRWYDFSFLGTNVDNTYATGGMSLKLEHDAAYQAGHAYCMPNELQIRELWEVTTGDSKENGAGGTYKSHNIGYSLTSSKKLDDTYNGVLISNADNTRSLWLPAGGACYNAVGTNQRIHNNNTEVQYWSRTLSTNSIGQAYCLDINGEGSLDNHSTITYIIASSTWRDRRYSGRQIRPVVLNNAIAPVSK